MSFPGLGTAILVASGPTTPIERTNPQSSSQTSGSSFSVTLPTHASGDLLLAIIAFSGSSNVSASAGWSLVARGIDNATGLAIYQKTATNSSGSLTITNSNAAQISALTYSFIGAGNAEGLVATATANPPSVTTSGPTAPNLWITALAVHDPGTVGAAPTGFSNTFLVDNAPIHIATGEKAQETTTVDPASWGASPSGDRVVATIAVEPS